MGAKLVRFGVAIVLIVSITSANSAGLYKFKPLQGRIRDQQADRFAYGQSGPEPLASPLEDASDLSLAIEPPTTPKPLLPSKPKFIIQGTDTIPHNYFFFDENLPYEMAAAVCRNFMQGARLLSLESDSEMVRFEMLLRSFSKDIFKRGGPDLLWTGGYFDLDSKDPYLLSWIKLDIKLDRPSTSVSEQYPMFCLSSDKLRETIDRALLNLQEKRANQLPSANSNLHSRLYVAIRERCWEIINLELDSTEEPKLPFVCKTSPKMESNFIDI